LLKVAINYIDIDHLERMPKLNIRGETLLFRGLPTCCEVFSI